MQKKNIFHDSVEVGDSIVCGGKYLPVLAIKTHNPGNHEKSPIHDHYFAVEYVTSNGSRWRGFTTSSDKWSGWSGSNTV